MYACVYVMRACAPYIYIYIYIDIYTQPYIHTYIYIYIYIYVCVYVTVCLWVCVFVRVYVCLTVSLYVCLFVSWVRLWGRAVLLAFSCLTSFGVAHVRLWLSPVGFVVRQFAWFVFNWCWYRFSIFVFVGLCCIICVSVNIYQAVVAGNVFGVVCTCLYNIPSTPFYDCIYKSVSVLSVVLLIWSMFGYIRIVLCFHYVIVCLLLFCFALLFAKSSLRVHSAVTRLNAHRLSWVWLKGMGKPGAGFPQCFFVLITIFIEGASKQNNRRTSLQQYCLLCELETTELLYESHLFRRKAASSQREPKAELTKQTVFRTRPILSNTSKNQPISTLHVSY